MNRSWRHGEFEAFCLRHAHRLFERAVAHGISPEDAEELVQNVLLRAHSRLDPDSHPESAANWLRTAIGWGASDILRRSQIARTRLLSEADLANLEAASAISFDFKIDLDHAVNQLPPIERQVFNLVIIQKCTEEEAGEILGKSQSQISLIKSRALCQLRDILAS